MPKEAARETPAMSAERPNRRRRRSARRDRARALRPPAVRLALAQEEFRSGIRHRAVSAAALVEGGASAAGAGHVGAGLRLAARRSAMSGDVRLGGSPASFVAGFQLTDAASLSMRAIPWQRQVKARNDKTRARRIEDFRIRNCSGNPRRNYRQEDDQVLCQPSDCREQSKDEQLEDKPENREEQKAGQDS